MQSPDEQAVLFVMEALDACGIQWMLTGSLTSNMFGIARATQDAGFIVKCDDSAIASLIERLDDRFEFNRQMKIRWGRNKDLPDAINLIAVAGDGIDWTYVENWCQRHSTSERLAEVRREAEQFRE